MGALITVRPADLNQGATTRYLPDGSVNWRHDLTAMVLSLPAPDRALFQLERTEVLSRFASTDDFAELRMFLEDLQNTAAIHSDSALSSALGTEIEQSLGSLVQ